MGFLDRIEQRIENRPAEPGGERAYALGQAVINRTDLVYGVDPNRFSPEKYGNYIATSNSVYSVVTQKADQLADLPIRLYKIKKGDRSRLNHRQLTMRRRSIMHNLRSHHARPIAFQRSIQAEELEEVTSGDLYELLSKVNPFWTGSRLIKMSEQALGLWGRAFWFLERGKSGRGVPREIWWGRSDLVRPVPHQDEYLEGFIYEPTIGGFERLDFMPSEVIWINYPNVIDEFSGLAPLAASRIYADHESAAMYSNLMLHKQGLQIGGIIMPADKTHWEPDTAAKIEEDIARRFGGVNNAHRWGAFKMQVEMKELGVTPTDAQFLDGLNWDLEAVARAYRWPLDLLGGRRTYENVNAAMVAAYVFSILPEAQFISSELGEQLLPMFPGDADLLWFDASDVHVLQEAEAAQWTREKEQIQAGALTVNEWRASQGKDPVVWGDIWWAPGKVVPVGGPELPPSAKDSKGDGKGQNQDEDQGQDEERLFRLFMTQWLRAGGGEAMIPLGAGDVAVSEPSAEEIATEAENKAEADSGYFDAAIKNLAGLLEAETEE